jgi:hypothetical protein
MARGRWRRQKSRLPGGARQWPGAGRRGMELTEAKWGGGGSPLMRCTLSTEGVEERSPVRMERSARYSRW